MPSGKVHAEVTLAAAGLTYFWGLASGETPVLAAAAAAGCAAGILINPDLDVAGTTRAERAALDIGLIPGLIWYLLWYPYGALIPHRSWLSHGILIGTLIRLVYIAIPLVIIGVLAVPGPLLIRAIGGLVISDNLHIGADFIYSAYRESVK